MPRTRKEVPVEIYSGPPPARQDSWKGTPLEEPPPLPADVCVREQAPESPPEPIIEFASVDHDLCKATGKPTTSGGLPDEAAEPAPEGPPTADEAQPALVPVEETASRLEAVEIPNIHAEASVSSPFGPEEPQAPLPTSPAPPAAEGGGSAARKELEDAIQRIEAHIMSERAARRAAEGALAQALQVASPAESPGIAALTGAQSELQVVLGDLANAQQAVQRAHGLVAALLAGAVLPAMMTSSVAQTPSVGGSLPLETPAAGFATAKPPIIAAAPAATATESAEDGEAMKWTAGDRSGGSVAKLKVRTLRRAPTTGPPDSQGTPTGEGGRRARGNGIPTAAAGIPTVRSPARGRREVSARTPAAVAAAEKEPGDRFETRKADAFMLRHSARWEPR